MKIRMKNKLIILLGIVLLTNLSLVYASITWSDGTITEFEITDTNSVCDSGLVWKEWNSVTEEIEETSSLSSCFRSNGWPSTTCCPNEDQPECILDPFDPDFGTCAGLAAPQFCANYNAERYGGDAAIAEDYCEGFNYEVANRSMISYTNINNICSGSYTESTLIDEEICYKIVLDCRCEWDDAEDVCVAKASRTNWICPDDIEITIEGNCSFAEISKQDDCNNSGYILYSWASAWEDDESDKPNWCEDGEKKYKCAAKLAFFTITNLIIAIILIVIIYIIWLKKKRKHK